MKYIIIIIASIILPSIHLCGQSYISPFIGFDLTKIENKIDGISLEYIDILENGYGVESPIIGFKLKHNFSQSIFIAFSTSFSHKNVKAYRNNFIDINGIKYNYFHNHASVCLAIQKFYLGFGGSYNLMQNMKYSYQTAGSKFESTDKGLIFILGKKVYKFDVEIYYYRGLSDISIKDFDLYLDPINSIGLTVSYPIQILNKLNNKQSCPKF